MIYAFGEFQLDIDRVELRGPDGPVPLEPKCFTVLHLLVRKSPHAVSKDEFFETVWPGVFVTDASLSTAIRQVRVALGDSAERQAFIRTVRGHGFHFVSAVEVLKSTQASVAAQPIAVPPPAVTTSSGKPTIAIRPFDLIGQDPAHQAISEAIPAELIATLSRLRWINVIARGSSFRFAATQGVLGEMGTRLGAEYVVSGLVEWHGPHLSIMVELSDTRSGQTIWSDRKTAPVSDIYETRARMARDLVTALELRLPMHEAERLVHMPSDSIDAWGHYHLGIRHMYRYNREDNTAAAQSFRAALALDPNFARAAAGLSYTEFQNAFQHFESDVRHHQSLALAHAEEAMRHDPLDPFCNLIYGRAKWLAGDAEDGLTWVDRAVELNPNYAFGFYNRATLNTVLCNSTLADTSIETALGLSPMDPHLQSMFGTRALAALISDNLEAATHYADRSMKSPNPHLYCFIIAAAIHTRTGAQDKAERCVAAIQSKGVPFGKTEFLTHFNLRDQDRLQSLVDSLEHLGL